MKLFIFALESYGASSSFDGGDTAIDFDQCPVIVGHQYAATLAEARRAVAEELADNEGIERPDFNREDEPEDSTQWDEYDGEVEHISNLLQFFELNTDGQHSTRFLS